MTKSKKRSLTPPPFVIDGFRTLFYAFIYPPITYSGHSSIIIGGREVGPVPCLALAMPLRGEGFEILHCDKNWNIIAHRGYDSLAKAKRSAERIYPGITARWLKRSVSKRKALGIERRMWQGEECSFCDRIPPEFHTMIHSKKARICNICIDEAYIDLIESEELDSLKPPRGDYYPEKWFDQIASYVSRLLVPAKRYKVAYFFALDRKRGFAIIASDPLLQASFLLDGQAESTHEFKVRAFFSSKNIRPSNDHLSHNKRSRFLQFPINGTVEELSALATTILQELCDVSPVEGLSIRLDER